MDHNEAACGACRRIGELICCEGCVAAFHCRCAGYDSPAELPSGDWYCWFCAKKRGLEFQHPAALFKIPRSSQTHVMVAVDEDNLDRFYRCYASLASDDYVELSFIDLQVQRDKEVVHKKSRRLWHGTIDKNAWSIEADGFTWRPNSRLFEIDMDAIVPGKKSAVKSQHVKSSRDSKTHAKSGGIQRVPEGQVGAGLPVIHGGSDNEEFATALKDFWKRQLGSGYPDQMPQCVVFPGHPISPWHLWREVWSWGGPDVVTDNKLWATIGFSFDAPFTSSAASSRVKKSYDLLIAPLDQAIDAGDLKLQRPPRCRQLKHRGMQIRPPLVPVSYGGSGAAVKRAGSGQAKQGNKKRKRGAWSSSDDEPADDLESEYEDALSSSEGDDDQSGSAEGDDSQQDTDHDDDSDDDDGAVSDEAQSSDEGGRGTPPAKRAKHAAGSKPTAAAAGGVVRPRVQATDSEVMARINLSAAAQSIKVGHVVDFRRVQQTDTCVTGWQSGIVLAIEPGSAWEGSRRLLIKPRHHQHHHNSKQQEPKPSVGSPAATALAAVTAAGCEGAAAAAQKLLTPSGHVRREVAGLIATQRSLASGDSKHTAAAEAPASSSAAAAGDGVGAVGRGTVEDSDDRPTWVPFVWRGSFSQPFPRPVVMVRPHYKPASAAAAGQLISTGSSSLLSAAAAADHTLQNDPSIERQQSVSTTQTGVSAYQLPQLAVGAAVEVLRQGSWWPAQVMAIKGPGRDAEKALSMSQQASLSASGGAAQSSGCVVLRNDDPPEGDGAVWRCSREHAMRAAHPQKGSWYGMLLSKREDMLPLPLLRKQLQPYIYAGGIQAFACLHHMVPEFGRE